jgi:hypothetical protein
MIKRVSRRARLTAVGAAVALTTTVAATPLAHADVTSGYLVSNTTNTSDPFVTQCTDLGSGFSGLCMYTSSDLGSGGTADNPYPMNQTLFYTLASGLDPGVQSNWVSHGTVFRESQITSNLLGGFVPADANHLWAPTEIGGADGLSYLVRTRRQRQERHRRSHLLAHRRGAVLQPARPFHLSDGDQNQWLRQRS